MDENVKNDAKQVMLVQNADDGRLQAVTGVDRDGNIQTTDPTDQNVASLLNVNTQDSALEAFFKKFMEQAQNPVHTGIFVMTENALNKLIRIDFDPEILENYRIDPSERLQTQEQRQFEPLDVTKIDLADMEKKGIRMEDIEPHLKAMSYGHKSNGLVEMNPELENGMRVSTKGRVSLEEQADGSLRVVPHYWQERPDLDAPFHGVLLDEEAKTNLMNTRHAGKVIDLELEPGKLTPCYVSIDKWTNTLEPMPVSLLEKRARIKEADLSEGKQMDFYGGGKVLLEGYTTRAGYKRDAYIQIDAAERRHCFMRWINISLMLHLVGPAAMRKSHARRNVFSLSGINFINGTRKISVLNCGIFIMPVCTRGRVSVYSRLVTGQSWISGSIFVWRIFRLFRFIMLRNVR